jgi:hypothetical protein
VHAFLETRQQRISFQSGWFQRLWTNSFVHKGGRASLGNITFIVLPAPSCWNFFCSCALIIFSAVAHWLSVQPNAFVYLRWVFKSEPLRLALPLLSELYFCKLWGLVINWSPKICAPGISRFQDFSFEFCCPQRGFGGRVNSHRNPTGGRNFVFPFSRFPNLSARLSTLPPLHIDSLFFSVNGGHSGFGECHRKMSDVDQRVP